MTTLCPLLARQQVRQNLFRLVAGLVAGRARLEAQPLILDIGRVAPPASGVDFPGWIEGLPGDLWESLACLVAPVGRGAEPILRALLSRLPEDLPLVLAGDGSGLAAALESGLAARLGGLRVHLESHLPRVLQRLDPAREPQAVLRGLRRLTALGRESGCPVVLEAPILSVNADHLDGLLTFAAELGISTVLFGEAGRLPAALDPRESYGARDLERLLERATAAATREGLTLALTRSRSDLWCRAGLPPDLVEILDMLRDLIPGRCPDLLVGLAADGRGTVRAGHLGCAPGPLVGEIQSGGFEQLWNGAAARRLRGGDWLPGPGPRCAVCPL